MGVSICADSEELSRDYSWSIWCFLLRIAPMGGCRLEQLTTGTTTGTQKLSTTIVRPMISYERSSTLIPSTSLI